MLHRYHTLDLRDKLLLGGTLGLAVNGVLYFFDIWMPKLLIVALASLFVGFLLKKETSLDL